MWKHIIKMDLAEIGCGDRGFIAPAPDRVQ
jgi:hypothetical protein